MFVLKFVNYCFKLCSHLTNIHKRTWTNTSKCEQIGTSIDKYILFNSNTNACEWTKMVVFICILTSKVWRVLLVYRNASTLYTIEQTQLQTLWCTNKLSDHVYLCSTHLFLIIVCFWWILSVRHVCSHFFVLGLYSRWGYSSRFSRNCEQDEVWTNADIHTLEWELRDRYNSWKSWETVES